MVIQLTGTNRNGSPELSLSGGNSSTFAWSPFGGSAARAGNTTSLPGFNGERQDPLSGVTHLGNGYRAYSPALHRFTCPDSESPFGGGGINPYTYCDHDPVNNTDPSGHMPGSAEVKAARMAKRQQELADKMASSMSLTVPPPTKASGAASISSGIQETTGVPNQTRERRGGISSEPVPGTSSQASLPSQVTPYKPKESEMAPAYLWAVKYEPIQSASGARFNISEAKGLILDARQDPDFFKRVKPDLGYSLDSMKGSTGKEVSDSLNALILKAGKPTPVTLYRGIPKGFVGKPGTVIRENRFTATTSSFDIAKTFSGPGGSVVHITGGHPIHIPNVYYGMASAGEAEYLYPRNTVFSVSQDPKTKRIIYTAK